MTDNTRTCTVEGCTEPRSSRGYCTVHYARWRKTGNPGPPERIGNRRSKPCTVEGCERPHRGKGFCGLHYTRWRNTGDPGPVELLRRRPGDQMPECSVQGCDNESASRGWCTMHYERWRTSGDPGEPQRRILAPGQVKQCTVEGCERDHYRAGICMLHYSRKARGKDLGPADARPPGSWNVKETIGYDGAHGRVRAKKGSASQYKCVGCGDAAAHWAYDNKDPDELVGTSGFRGEGLRYSTNPDHYQPMCVPCHRRFDTLNRAS